MIGVCTKCGKAFEATTEDAYTPGVLCVECYRAEHNPPGTSPIYAVAGDMLAAVAPGDSLSMATVGAWVGTCHVRLTRYGNEWALWLMDVHRIERSTLATWAAAIEQPASAWLVDEVVGGKVARLAWHGAGVPMPPGGGVVWIGQAK